MTTKIAPMERGGHTRARIQDGRDGFTTYREYPSLMAMLDSTCWSGNDRVGMEDHVAGFTMDPTKRGYVSGQGSKWTGGIHSLGQYKQMVERGWPEGLDKVERSLKALKPTRAQSIKRVRRRGPFGDTLDIHRVYAGNIEGAWDRRVRGSRHGPKVVSIYVHVSTIWSRTADEMFWRGAAALAISRALEDAGYRTRIVGIYINDWVWADSRGMRSRGYSYNKVQGKSAGDAHFMACEVKASNQTVSPAALAAMLCHPSTTRIVGFCHLMGLPRKIASYFGMPKEPALDLQAGEIEIRNIWSQAQAQELVDAALKPYA